MKREAIDPNIMRLSSLPYPGLTNQLGTFGAGATTRRIINKSKTIRVKARTELS